MSGHAADTWPQVVEFVAGCLTMVAILWLMFGRD